MSYEELKAAITRLVRQIENDEWSTVKIVYQAQPFINKAYTSLPAFYDPDGKMITLFPKPDAALDEIIYALIIVHNQHGNRMNEITFTGSKDDRASATITTAYNPEIDVVFNSYLPKSKRGKTVAWFHTV